MIHPVYYAKLRTYHILHTHVIPLHHAKAAHPLNNMASQESVEKLRPQIGCQWCPL